MHRKLLGLSTLLLSGAVASGEKAHWEYSGQAGPDHWATLSAEYSGCAGRNQSPINLTGFIDAELKPIGFSYAKGAGEILNNGHTVQINTAAGSSILVDGKKFELKQFHFHAPSENQINGKSFALEGHLVHADADGNLAVVAVLFDMGTANQILGQAWKQMPHEAGAKAALASSLDPSGLLPAKRDYYRFSGSLTTPPCTEGVRWLVMKATMTASREQIDAFKHTLHHPNNRPVQPINAREVLE